MAHWLVLLPHWTQPLMTASLSRLKNHKSYLLGAKIAQCCEISFLFLPAPAPLDIPPPALSSPASRRPPAPITPGFLPPCHPPPVKVGTPQATSRCNMSQMSLQHVAATNHSLCTGRATSCCNTNFNHFVAATSRRKSNQFEFVRLVAATKFCCSDKDFYKNSPVHMKRFVAATCRRDVLQRLVV